MRWASAGVCARLVEMRRRAIQSSPKCLGPVNGCDVQNHQSRRKYEGASDTCSRETPDRAGRWRIGTQGMVQQTGKLMEMCRPFTAAVAHRPMSIYRRRDGSRSRAGNGEQAKRRMESRALLPSKCKRIRWARRGEAAVVYGVVWCGGGKVKWSGVVTSIAANHRSRAANCRSSPIALSILHDHPCARVCLHWAACRCVLKQTDVVALRLPSSRAEPSRADRLQSPSLQNILSHSIDIVFHLDSSCNSSKYHSTTQRIHPLCRRADAGSDSTRMRIALARKDSHERRLGTTSYTFLELLRLASRRKNERAFRDERIERTGKRTGKDQNKCGAESGRSIYRHYASRAGGGISTRIEHKYGAESKLSIYRTCLHHSSAQDLHADTIHVLATKLYVPHIEYTSHFLRRDSDPGPDVASMLCPHLFRIGGPPRTKIRGQIISIYIPKSPTSSLSLSPSIPATCSLALTAFVSLEVVKGRRESSLYVMLVLIPERHKLKPITPKPVGYAVFDALSSPRRLMPLLWAHSYYMGVRSGRRRDSTSQLHPMMMRPLHLPCLYKSTNPANYYLPKRDTTLRRSCLLTSHQLPELLEWHFTKVAESRFVVSGSCLLGSVYQTRMALTVMPGAWFSDHMKSRQCMNGIADIDNDRRLILDASNVRTESVGGVLFGSRWLKHHAARAYDIRKKKAALHSRTQIRMTLALGSSGGEEFSCVVGELKKNVTREDGSPMTRQCKRQACAGPDGIFIDSAVTDIALLVADGILFDCFSKPRRPRFHYKRDGPRISEVAVEHKMFIHVSCSGRWIGNEHLQPFLICNIEPVSFSEPDSQRRLRIPVGIDFEASQPGRTLLDPTLALICCGVYLCWKMRRPIALALRNQGSRPVPEPCQRVASRIFSAPTELEHSQSCLPVLVITISPFVPQEVVKASGTHATDTTQHLLWTQHIETFQTRPPKRLSQALMPLTLAMAARRQTAHPRTRSTRRRLVMDRDGLPYEVHIQSAHENLHRQANKESLTDIERSIDHNLSDAKAKRDMEHEGKLQIFYDLHVTYDFTDSRDWSTLYCKWAIRTAEQVWSSRSETWSVNNRRAIQPIGPLSSFLINDDAVPTADVRLGTTPRRNHAKQDALQLCDSGEQGQEHKQLCGKQRKACRTTDLLDIVPSDVTLFRTRIACLSRKSLVYRISFARARRSPARSLTLGVFGCVKAVVIEIEITAVAQAARGCGCSEAGFAAGCIGSDGGSEAGCGRLRKGGGGCVDNGDFDCCGDHVGFTARRAHRILEQRQIRAAKLDRLLRDCRGVARAHIDDITMFSKTLEEQLHHLEAVSAISPEKTFLGCPSATLLMRRCDVLHPLGWDQIGSVTFTTDAVDAVHAYLPPAVVFNVIGNDRLAELTALGQRQSLNANVERQEHCSSSGLITPAALIHNSISTHLQPHR
ncbi:uncharacterized protein MYCFIDRAFT_180471 [Pseudocercospora fijiensis CIRAD86]|uniref:Uncharacterized protein n=1 Tax=Pseudocercospora fijiensis (strain CIRAD86) TaxID=383855 RepID=M2ZXZ3_PSEFD|nr:uncharacterized protein MYCFIDRAFT_180471 [Pseudocercospora fijiensis CIRAD86]EME76986.1 hypothetical protein MYCFIDRAFT_180471 [Pseudocercospora fijiensis CIRAD86]